MSKTDTGVLIFTEWFESLRELNPKQFKAVLMAMYEYQIKGIDPPEFTGGARMVSNLIFPYITRRKQQAAFGRLGSEARYGRLPDEDGAEGSDRSDTAISHPNSPLGHEPITFPPARPSSSPSSTPANHRIEKNKIEKLSIEERSVEEKRKEDPTEAHSHRGCEELSEDALSKDALSENARAEKEKKCCFGVHKNVLLTRDDYEFIKAKIPNADSYIDKFSAKLHTKGYQYPNHAQALLDWYERDSKFGYCGSNDASHRDGQSSDSGSFNTDSFFEAAVRKSLGEEAFDPVAIKKALGIPDDDKT